MASSTRGLSASGRDEYFSRHVRTGSLVAPRPLPFAVLLFDPLACLGTDGDDDDGDDDGNGFAAVAGDGDSPVSAGRGLAVLELIL